MVLKNATLLTLHPARVERMDLRIESGEITGKARTLPPKRAEEVVDLAGRYILPGMVNAHTHLYSALACGMPSPKTPPRTFVDVLRKVWWRLDEALDDEAIYYSALVGSIEAAKYGTTSFIDHHASPNRIKGSLDIIKKAIGTVGLRGVLCYETTDRGGIKRRDAGLEENERFIAGNGDNAHFRGTAGAHASFTLNDGTMQALGEMSERYDCGVHVHVAEDKVDVEDAAKNRGIDLMKRLLQFGLLSHKSILAHGVHLSKRQISAIDQSGAWLVHNPRSNMNNAIGYAPLRWFCSRSTLGTDGFPSDMFEESKIGFLRNQESDHKVEFGRLPEMLHKGQELLSSFFGRAFGTLNPRTPADLIVLEYASPTPLVDRNLLSHFLFGMNSGMLSHTMIDGQWLIFNRQFVGIDEEKIISEATRVAKRLWKRMEKRG